MAIDKPKKKKTTAYGVGSKTVTKKSGATKKTKISADGRKKTVTRTSKIGATKSRTTDISSDYKSATYTKKKDGKVVNERKQKTLTAKQANLIAASPGDYKSTAIRRKKKHHLLTNTPKLIKAKEKKKAEKWFKKTEKKEVRKDARDWQKNANQMKRYVRKGKSAQKTANRKNNSGRVKTLKEIGVDIKDACKGKTARNKKSCAMPRSRRNK